MNAPNFDTVKHGRVVAVKLPLLNPVQRARRMIELRDQTKKVFAVGGMSDGELFDWLNLLASSCAPEQSVAKAALLDICCDMEDEPDADAFKGCLVPSALDSRVEAP